jgi:glycine/D-amino acid oxidase-like deaminating enzyme
MNRVVVVGAGVMGAWTALWLGRRGHDVTLLDAHGAGSSLATSGDETRVTRSAHGRDTFYPRWQRRALAAWRELEAKLRQPLFLPTGVLWLAGPDDEVEATSLAALRELGIPAERLSPEEVAARWTPFATEGLAWALHEPEAGVLMARRAVVACLDEARRAGVAIVRARCLPPRDVDAAGGRLARVRLADGTSLEADAFVFAAGPWLPALLPEQLGGGRLAVTRQEVVYLAPPAGDDRFDAGRLPTWVDYRSAVYGLPSIEGRGMKVAPDRRGPIIDPDAVDRRLSDEAVAEVRTFLARRMPEMAGRPVAEGRVCQYESTPDAHFVIDRHPGWDNAWLVGGGSGHAFKHGPAIGEYAAALAAGDQAAADGLGPGDGRFALGERMGTAIGLRTSAAARSRTAGEAMAR